MLYSLPAPPVPGQLSSRPRCQAHAPRRASAWTVAFAQVNTAQPTADFTRLEPAVLAQALGVTKVTK